MLPLVQPSEERLLNDNCLYSLEFLKRALLILLNLLIFLLYYTTIQEFNGTKRQLKIPALLRKQKKRVMLWCKGQTESTEIAARVTRAGELLIFLSFLPPPLSVPLISPHSQTPNPFLPVSNPIRESWQSIDVKYKHSEK